MTVQVFQAIGGLGLFLLGMIVLTEGLRALAGDAVHRILFRFTKSPTSGALTGAGVTAVLQSSSVTTVTTVGFVSAGLLAFPQALGVMFGANIGTTATGWMVALLGFKLDIGRLVLPLLFAGVMLRLFGRGRLANAGWALAGFAVIFLGIDAMQAGMAGFEGVMTPDDFPPDTLVGRVLLIGIGAAVTLVTQSSSAGVATALTAVDAGALSFPQAAAIVIGMDVGTTSTTAIATLGGSAQTKRTGYAHVVYNLLTGVAAFLLLDPYVLAVDALFDGGPAANPTIALVGFHTAFNTLGVAAVLPFTKAFARLMNRIVPEKGPELAARLDPALLGDPTAAALSLFGAVRAITAELFAAIGHALDPAHPAAVERERLERVDRAVDEARRFADRINAPPDREEAQRLLLASMHAIDHLDRLIERGRRRERIATLRKDERLRELSAVVWEALAASAVVLRGDEERVDASGLLNARDTVRAERQPYRQQVLADVPGTEVTLDEAIQRLDAIRWLHRTAYHAWRIAHNLDAAREPEPVAVTEHPSRAEIEREEET